MKTYIGTKLIQAKPQARAFNKNTGENGVIEDGYMVMYEDGYISWSPKDVFEKAYREIDLTPFLPEEPIKTIEEETTLANLIKAEQKGLQFTKTFYVDGKLSHKVLKLVWEDRDEIK